MEKRVGDECMRRSTGVVWVCGFWLGLLLMCATVAGQDAPGMTVTGGFVFDTELGVFVPNPGLSILGDRFVERTPESRQLELTSEHYILPGFVDCHAHYNVRLISKRREEFEYMPLLYLANGATVTFSAGEYDPLGMVHLRERLERGEQIGPRLITSGPYFGRARPGWDPDRDEQEIRKEVDYWVSQGAGGFKAKAIDPKSLRVLIDQAHKHGLTVTGHLDSGFRNSVNPRDAITIGIDRIEHFVGGDAMPETQSAYQSLQSIVSGTPAFRDICKHFIDHGVFFDCTLTAYGYFGEITAESHPEYQHWVDERQFFTPHMQRIALERPPRRGMEIYQRIYRAKQLTIADFFRAGGLITLGTDHVSDGSFVAGFGIHREIDALVRNGIPARDALRIATINGAKALGIDADHGSIAVGKVADLVVVRGNPLEDIRNTRNVEKVMTRGRLYEVAELLDKAKGKLGPADVSQEQDW